MRFRWVVFLSLWTFLAGPIFAEPEELYESNQTSQSQAALPPLPPSAWSAVPPPPPLGKVESHR